MKLGRFVGPIALLVVLALFLFSFYGFKDQSSPPSRNSAPGPDRVKIHDIVYLWTDPGSKEFVDDFNALLRQEKDKPNKNYAVDYLQPKGMSFLRFFLRGVLENCDWFNRVWIIRPNSRIPIPAFANASHPQLNFVTYEDFMPSQHLPNYHWRAVVTYLTKLEGLSENFIFVPEGSYFIDTVRQTHLVSEINGHMIYNYDEGTAPKDGLDRTVLLETQKLVPEVPDDVNVLEFETRTPVLVKKTIMDEVIAAFPAQIERTRALQFLSKDAIDPLLLYQLYLVKKGRAQRATVNATGRIRAYDTNNDGQLEGEELRRFILYLRWQPMRVREYAGAPASGPASIHERYRYHLAPTLTEVIDVQTSIGDTLDEKFSKLDETVHSVIYFGDSVLRSKLNSVRTRLERFFADRFSRSVWLEIDIFKYYNMSVGLAIACLVFFFGGFFAFTKLMTSSHRSRILG